MQRYRYPQHEELGDKGELHTYEVFYPSGKRFRLTGVYGAIAIPGGDFSPWVRISAKDVVMLDPRAVVVRHPENWVIHNPRRVHPRWPSDITRHWLQHHPKWPPDKFHPTNT